MSNSIVGAKKKERKPRIAVDSAASISTAKLLYGLAEGEVYGLADGAKSIRLDGTPLVDDNGNGNFNGVRWTFAAGTNDQGHVSGFPDVTNEIGVGVELKSSQPWIKAITDTQLSAVRVRFKWNRLSKTNADNGDVTGYKIDYAIDLQTDGGAYHEIIKTKIQEKTSAGYERTHRIDLPKAKTGWQIRVRRLTPNDPSEYVQDTMMIDAIAEVIDVKLTYPNTALLGIEYNAEIFSSVAKIEVDMMGSIIRVPSNYDPVARTYNGIWDGTFKDAYSNNPAWVYYDLCRQWRYGLGERLDATMIDKWSLYTLGQYCDQPVSDGQGGLEPRFTCNVYLQKQADAYQVLSNIAGIFRGMSYWNGEKIFADADVPQDPVYTFSRANVIDGNFEYTGTRARDRHTLAKVAWDNPLNSYQTEYEYVRDEKAMAKLGVKVLELNAFGCTSQAQAQRAGLWALKTEQLETRQVSFGAGLDALKNITVGNIINVSDELFAGRANGGRVSEVSGRRIKIDRDVVVNIGDVLTLNCSDGINRSRVVTSVGGRYIYTSTSIPNAESENVWAIETADLKLMRFRVMSITQNDDVTFNITAIQHEPQKYDAVDFGTDVKPTEITIINPEAVDAPASVTITSRHRVVQGQTVTTLIIGWAQVSGAVAYDVEWRKDDGSWIKLPRTGNVSVEIEGVYSGNYMARVRSVSAFDVQSQATTSALIAIEGKVGLPPTIVGLTATGVLFGMDLKWGFQQGSGDADYTEIQVGSAPNVNVATLGEYSYPTNIHTINGLQGNLAQSYRARLVDKLGFKSPWSAWVTGTTDADANKILDIIDGEIKQSHLYNELSSKIDKVDEIQPIRDALGSSDDPNSVLGQLQDTKDRFGDDEKLLNAMEQAIKAEGDAEFKSFKDLVDEDGRLGGIIERDLGEDQDGLVFGKLEGVFAQIGDEKMAGDDNRWAGDNTYYAGVWSLQSARIEGDMAQATRIDGVASQVNDNQAQILEVSRTSASENEVTARKLTGLSAQLVGGSESSDLNNITSGLIFDEMSLRIQEDDALAERISMLSVGVGESFDSFKIWHFDDGAEGWIGGIYTAGVLEARTGALVSPALTIDIVDDDGQPLTEQISTTRYHHLKMRVTKVGSPTWSGGVSWSGGSLNIDEPIWTAEGDTVVNVDLAWTGTVTNFSITLASTADADKYYKIDWIAVGSPSPAASSAQLSRIDRVNASRYHSASQAITLLDSEVNGENGEKSLAQIRSEFSTVSSNASSAADAIDLLSTQYSTDLVTFYGDVLGESNSLSSELGTVATQLDGVFAQVTTRWSGDGIESERWAGDDRPDDAVGVWSERSATIEGDLYLAEQIDGLAVQVGSNNASILSEQVARVRGNTALAAEQRQLSTVVGNNTADILELSLAVTTPESGLAARVTQLQSQTEQAVILAGNKGEIIYSYGQPPAEKQLEQNLWFKIDGDATTPHVWDDTDNKWIALTDKEAATAKADAAEALGAAQEAQGIADSKGEVIYGSTQPNVLKRLPQNLWIDTRNGVNTPKRWINGEWREVTDKVAKDAASAASEAKGAADAAQGAADLAQQAADLALDDLGDISDDGKVTPTEKIQIKTIWLEIKETDAEVRANAAKYEVNLGTYPAAYTALENHVNALLLDMSTTINVDRDTFDGRFEIYYRRRADVNRNIVTAAEKQAADAQSTANNKGENIYSPTAPSVDKQLPQNIWYKIEGNVVTAHAWSNGKWTPIVDKGAADAKTAAESAEAKAQEAKDDLSDIYADGKVTPSEKQQIKTIWTEIVETDAEVRANADKYDVSLGTYPTAYTELETLVNGLLLDMNATINVNRTTLDSRFEIYYRRRAAINRNIVTAAEQATKDAAGAASAAKDAADEADRKAVVAQGQVNDISADGKLTPVEKKQAKLIWSEIARTDTEVRANAAKYKVSVTTYSSAYSALDTYLQGLITGAEANTTSNIDRAAFDKAFADVYAARAEVNKLIVAAAEKQAADAQDTANDKGEIIYSDTTPPANKRNPQNLWIHTGENNGNTPKMWSSAQSKWVIVSDQKAIDALEKANDTRTNLATYVEESGAFSNEFGAISGNITTLQRRQNGQTDSIEIVAALGDAEKLKNEIAKARLDKDVDALNEKDAKLEALIAEYNASRADAVAKRNAAPADVRPVYQQIIVSIDEAKADVNAQRAAIAAQVSQLISEKAELDSLVQTESDVKAQYFVKFDVDNRAAGFGMMQNADATIDFAVLADKFYIASPDATDKGIAPFYVQTTTQNGRPAGTYIRDAFIGDAAITTAKINDAAITTAKIGNLQVDTAQIANGAIKTAKIGNAQVNTLQLAGQAVIHPVIQYTAGNYEFYTIDKEEVINTATVNAQDGSVSISFGFERLSAPINNRGGVPSVILRIKRNGTAIRTMRLQTEGLEYYLAQVSSGGNYVTEIRSRPDGLIHYEFVNIPTFLDDNAPSGANTYTVTLESRGLNAGQSSADLAIRPVVITARSLHIMGVKR